MTFHVNRSSMNLSSLPHISFVPNSYGVRERNLSVYAQRVWWCYSVDTSAMVDRTKQLVFQDVFDTQPTSIVAYKYTREGFLKGEYVTIIKRFCKKVSVLQVFDDWICKHYPTKRNGIDEFSIWHPTRSEIKDRVMLDEESMGFQREKLWCYEEGAFYQTIL